MARTHKAWLAWVLQSVSAAAQGIVTEKTPAPASPDIRLFYYDYAKAPASVITEGMKTAERIFSHAGIRFTPIQLRPEWNEPQATLRNNQTPVLYLRILPDSMANRLGPGVEAIGSAYSTEDNSGQIANVFYGRLEGLQTSAACSRGVMLGHVIAHELGHLLLGHNSHSSSGIMSPNWQRDNQIIQIRSGALLFTPEEADRIRKNVSDRRRLLSPTSILP